MHSFLWPFFPPFFLPSSISCSFLSFDPSPLPEDSSSCWRRERGRKGRRWWKRLRTPGLSELPPSCCHSFPLHPPNSAFYFTLYFFTLGRYISPPGVETCYHRNTFPSINHFSFLFLLYNTLLSLFRAPVWTPQLIHSPITLQSCSLLRLFMFLVTDFVWRWPVTRKCLFWEKVKARNTPVCAFIKTFIHSEDLWGYHERIGLLSLTTDCVHVLKQYKFLFFVFVLFHFGQFIQMIWCKTPPEHC